MGQCEGGHPLQSTCLHECDIPRQRHLRRKPRTDREHQVYSKYVFSSRKSPPWSTQGCQAGSRIGQTPSTEQILKSIDVREAAHASLQHIWSRKEIKRAAAKPWHNSRCSALSSERCCQESGGDTDSNKLYTQLLPQRRRLVALAPASATTAAAPTSATATAAVMAHLHRTGNLRGSFSTRVKAACLKKASTRAVSAP